MSVDAHVAALAPEATEEVSTFPDEVHLLGVALSHAEGLVAGVVPDLLECRPPRFFFEDG